MPLNISYTFNLLLLDDDDFFSYAPPPNPYHFCTATKAFTFRSTYESAIPPTGGFDLRARARAALVRGFERNRGGRPPPPPAATTAARCSLGAVRRESPAEAGVGAGAGEAATDASSASS